MASVRGLVVLFCVASAAMMLGAHAQDEEEGGRIPHLCQVVSASAMGMVAMVHQRLAEACIRPFPRPDDLGLQLSSPCRHS